MDHLKNLSFLRDKITTAKSNGEDTELLEALLALGEAMARGMKRAISHVERTIPKGDA